MIDDELRARLRQVDDLTPPPAPDFAARAIADAAESTEAGITGAGITAVETTGDETTGDETRAPATVTTLAPRRRPRWAVILPAAAAAVVIGAVTVNGLPHLGGSTTAGSSAVSGAESAKAGDAAAAAPTPLTPSGPNSAPVVTGGRAVTPFSRPTETPPVLATIGGETLATGEDATSTDVATAAQSLADRLGAPPTDDVFTGLAVASAPAGVEVHLTAFDDPVIALVVRGLPTGTPITFVQSDFSLRACRSALARVQADLPTLTADGVPVGDPRCLLTGQVALTVTGSVTDAQRARLVAAYGLATTLVRADGSALP